MDKNLLNRWAILATAAVLTLCNTITFAYPIKTPVLFSCPCTSQLFNLGNYIAGSGSELIFNKNNPVNFTSTSFLAAVPEHFNNYQITGIDYESVLGKVTCSYASNLPNDLSFTLSYKMMNGTGGLIQTQTTGTISILLPIGLK